MPDPNMLFERRANGRGYFLLSEATFGRDTLTQWAKDKGITDGKITREQFQAYFNERLKDGPFGMKPPVPPPGGPPGTPPGTGGSPGTGAPPGRDDAKERMDQWVEMRFKERDRNGDGFLNVDEMPDSLRADLARWDVNKDGLIDLNEYKAYAAHRYQAGPQTNAQPVVSMIIEEELDRRPVIFRAGKLPKELPSWFEQLDTDGDGQVALYEWRQGKRDLDEFKSMDRNDDGYLTAEEVLRHQNQSQTAKKTNSSTPGPIPVSSNDNGSGPGRRFENIFQKMKGFRR